MSFIGQSTSFSGSNLQGANFDHASGMALRLSQCDLSGAQLTNTSFKGECVFPPKCLSINGCTLNGTKFAGSSFDMTSFNAVDLTKANLTGVVRSAVGASFANTNLAGLDFSGFDFTGALFTSQTPAGAVSQASLQGTSFQGANFTYAYVADYTSSQLSGADYTNATFKQTLVDDLDNTVLASKSGTREAKGDAYDPFEADVATLDKLGLDSSGCAQMWRTEQISLAAMKQMSAADQAGAAGTTKDASGAQSDIDKALAILKDYAAGKGEKTDADKALATLKDGIQSNGSNAAALLLLKNAAEASQKFIIDRFNADHTKVAATGHAKTASANPNTGDTGGTTQVKATSAAQSGTGSMLNVAA